MPPPLIGRDIKRWCCLTSVCLSAYIMNIHGTHSYWKQGALGTAGIRHVWAGAGLQHAAYRGGGISCGLAHSLFIFKLLNFVRIVSPIIILICSSVNTELKNAFYNSSISLSPLTSDSSSFNGYTDGLTLLFKSNTCVKVHDVVNIFAIFVSFLFPPISHTLLPFTTFGHIICYSTTLPIICY